MKHDADATGQRHIIRRPRLEQTLDSARAQILLLVAPAGYGKTTLAQQWLSTKHAQDIRWVITPAGADDPAAMALVLADCLAMNDEGAAEAIREHLASQSDRFDPAATATFLLETLGEEARADWLVVEDLHLASAPAEALVDEIARFTHARLLITTRRRPSWATARRLVYGEVFELGHQSLAMTHEEAARLLVDEPVRASALVSLAEGWPAVLGLAAIVGSAPIPEGTLPRSLYDFLAEELLKTLSVDLRRSLYPMALASEIDVDLARDLLGETSERALQEGVRAGVLSESAGKYEMHPLMRQFVLEQRQRDGEIDGTEARRVLQVLLRFKRWDQAFEVVRVNGLRDEFGELLAAAGDDLLRSGRVDTLARWLSEPGLAGESAPALIVSGEVALRSGDHRRAERLALQATVAATDGHERRRALTLAGQASHLLGDAERTYKLFTEALALASAPEDSFAAVYGQFLAAVELDIDLAETTFEKLTELQVMGSEAALRVAGARIMLRVRQGDLRSALAAAVQETPAATTVSSPMVVSAFHHALAYGLAAAARYDEALDRVEQAASLAREVRLPFAQPFLQLVRATALAGSRRFVEAASALEEIAEFRVVADRYFAPSLALVRARVFIGRSELERALEALDIEASSIPVQSLAKEYLSLRALLLAALAATSDAKRDVASARAMRVADTTSAVTLASAEAVLDLQQGQKPAKSLARIGSEVSKTGVVDPLVVAYRASPPLLNELLTEPSTHDLTVATLERSRDQALPIQGSGPEALSRREREVLVLISRGLSNREIARELYISEATAKVHVHNILEKLGVKSRTQAALRGMRLQATSVSAGEPSSNAFGATNEAPDR